MSRSKGDTTVRDTAPATPPAQNAATTGCENVSRTWSMRSDAPRGRSSTVCSAYTEYVSAVSVDETRAAGSEENSLQTCWAKWRPLRWLKQRSRAAKFGGTTRLRGGRDTPRRIMAGETGSCCDGKTLWKAGGRGRRHSWSTRQCLCIWTVRPRSACYSKVFNKFEAVCREAP